jgi:hypothetical protein
MANKKISSMTELAATPASGDKVPLVDVSDTTGAATGTTKWVSVDNLVSEIAVADMAASAVVLEAEGIGSNDNDTTLPTSAAVKDYVDGKTHLELGLTSSTALAGDTTTISAGQASAITANTAKTGITSGQASAITANTAKTGITAGQASAITANTAKTGITSGQASAITANTSKTGISSGQASEITANTLKTGITSGQASAITANTAKTGITSGQASEITANTAKTGITAGQASAITANTAKTGITSGQASAITANTAKTGITSGQASAITANTAKATNATHTGEVTGSGALTLADDIVDEANLKGVGTATNDHVLTADSTATGGMKWAASSGGGSAPEGTAVLSTGEAGATKFLREDGDGTSSWQVPSGAGTVTGTGADNQVAVWDSTSGIEGTSSLVFDGTGLGIGTSPDAGYKLHVQQDGANANAMIEAGAGYNLAALDFRGDGVTQGGIYGTTSGSSGYLSFSTNNAGSIAERLRITSGGDCQWYEDTGTTPKMTWDSSASRLGIGVTVPAAPLDVEASNVGNYSGRFTNTHATSGNGIRIQTPGTATNEYQIVSKSNAGSQDNFWVRNDGTASFPLGPLGIGTAAPTGAKLDIRTDSTTIIDAGATLNVEEDTAWTQGIAFYINNADAYNADYASACIGVANSGSGLILSSGAKVIASTDSANGYKTLNSTTAAVYRQKAGAHIFYSNTGETANTAFTPVERMRITEAGDVQWGTSGVPAMTWDASASRLGIGVSVPVTTLNIKGDESANGQLYIEPTGDGEYAGLVVKTTRGADREWGVFAGGTGADDLNFRIRDETANADRLNITSAGRVTVKKSSNAEVTALTSSSASTAVDMDAANNFSLALAENTTLAQPTNITAGQSGAIVITQDATGSRTMAYNAYWKFEGGTAPVLSTTGGQVDTLAYYVASATSIHAVLLKNMS